MRAIHEEPGVNPTGKDLRQAFAGFEPQLVEELKKCSAENVQTINDFVFGIATNQTNILFGTELYDRHMEQQAEEFLSARPFGIEMDTLSHNARLFLMPRTIFPPGEFERELAKEEEVEVQEEGPQAIVYILDGFEKDTVTPPIFTANLLFMAHLAEALSESRYPLVEGERSEEFENEVAHAFRAVKEYLAVLPAGTISLLPRKMQRLHALSPDALQAYAEAFATYNTEPVKAPGLLEKAKKESESTDDVVKNGHELLQLSQRDLPLVEDGPEDPWKEYTTNRWNRSHRLYGRYQAGSNGDTTLRVDYQLDSTHYPLNYGFFSAIEITEIIDGKMQQHAIFGQEVGEGLRAIPVIVAGEIDFSNFDNVTRLQKLAHDENTKIEIADVMRDILKQSENGMLRRVE